MYIFNRLQENSFMLLYIIVIYCTSTRGDIVEDVSKYFQSETFQNFQNIWEPQRKMYENAIDHNLKNVFGKNDQLSIFVSRPLTDIFISEGVFVDDNVAIVLFSGLYLQQLPRILESKVLFSFASNTLDVSSHLWRIITTANYEVFTEDQQRTSVQDPYKTSPFVFPKVKRQGNVTIIAEECVVTGHVLAQLHNSLVVLGHDTFHIANCSFSVEITSPDSEAPVIAPYFSTKHARFMEKLLTAPVRQELRVVLQAAMYEYLYMNNSAILGPSQKTIEKSQSEIIEKTRKDLSQSAEMANERTREDNRIAIEMKPLSIVWNNMEKHLNFDSSKDFIQNGNDTHALVWKEQREKSKLRFSNVTVYGLDSLYSSHVGGAKKDRDTVSISDTLRLASLFVRGQIVMDFNVDIFVAELKDVELNLEYNLNDSSSLSIETIDWRSLEVSLLNSGDSLWKSLIVGYIQSKLPMTIENHLKTVYQLFGSAYNNLTTN